MTIINLEEKPHNIISNEINWQNKDNAKFYATESVIKILEKEYSHKGGLDTHCDMEMVSKYIFNSRSILDIGTGYGRTIDFLIKNNYSGEIHAIERSPILCKILKEKFGQKITLCEVDVMEFTTEKKFDLLLWMWCGISDFTPQEQLYILQKFKKLLTPKGIFIIDTLLDPFLQANHSPLALKQNYVAVVDGQTAYGYIPTSFEISRYAELADYTNSQHLEYKTVTDRRRALHILRN